MTITTPLESGNYYHIYNRGNNSEIIFHEDNDYKHFLNLLFKHVLPVCNLYCYCLLNNHFHLLIMIREEESHGSQNNCLLSITQRFSNFFNAYAKKFNKKYNRSGRLFEERFKRKKVDSDFYFTELIYYIHANPQRHKIIGDFRGYKYSSYQIIMSSKVTKLNRDKVLEWFGDRTIFEQAHLERISCIMDYDFLDW